MAHKRKAKDKKKKSEAMKKIVLPKPPENIFKDFPIESLGTADSTKVKELFQLSSTVAALKKKYSDTIFQIKMSKNFIKEVKAGKIKGPLMFKVSDTLFMPIKDMDKLVEGINKDIKTLEDSNIITRGQLEHRYDEYIDSMIRLYRFLKDRVGKKELSNIEGHRNIDNKSLDEQRIIFEKELTDEMDLNIKKEMKEAIEKDKAKQKKD